MHFASSLREQELFHVLQMNDDMRTKLTETISYFSETNISLFLCKYEKTMGSEMYKPHTAMQIIYIREKTNKLGEKTNVTVLNQNHMWLHMSS